MHDPLQYFIDEQLVIVYYFPSPFEPDSTRGFVIFGNDSVREHVKMDEDALGFKIGKTHYKIDVEFYVRYGVECEGIEDAYNRTKAFRSIDLLWPPTSK